MNAKQYLRQAYRIDQLIRSNKKEIEELRELSTCISGIDTSKEVVQTSKSGDASYVKIIERIDELEKLIKSDIDKLLNLKIEIRNIIDSVPDSEERLLLHYRYLHFMNWEEICESMYVSERTIHRIHGRALNSVDGILNVGSSWH